MPKQSVYNTIRRVKQECDEKTVSESNTPAVNTRSTFILQIKKEVSEDSSSGENTSPEHNPQPLSTSNNSKKSPINKILRNIIEQGNVKVEEQDVDCKKSVRRECVNSKTLSASSKLRSFSHQGRDFKDYSLVDEKPQWLGNASNNSYKTNENAQSVAQSSAAGKQRPIRRPRGGKKVVLLLNGQPYEPPVTRSRTGSLLAIKREVVEDDKRYNLRSSPWRKKKSRAVETAEHPVAKRVSRNIKLEIENNSPNSIQVGPNLAPANLIHDMKKELCEDNNEHTSNSEQNSSHSDTQAQSAPRSNITFKSPVPEVCGKFVKKEKLVAEDMNEPLKQKQGCAAQIKQESPLQDRNLDLTKTLQPKKQTRNLTKAEGIGELSGELNGDIVYNSAPSRNKAGRNRINMKDPKRNNLDITEDLPIVATYQTRSSVKREVHRPGFADASSKSYAKIVKQEYQDTSDKHSLFSNPYSTESSSGSSPRRSSRKVIVTPKSSIVPKPVKQEGRAFNPYSAGSSGRPRPRKVNEPSKSSGYKVPRLVKQERRAPDDKSVQFLNPYAIGSGLSLTPRRSSRIVNKPSKPSGYKVPRLVKQEKRDSDDKRSPCTSSSSSSACSSPTSRRSSRIVNKPSKPSGYKVPRLLKQEKRDSDDKHSHCTSSSSSSSCSRKQGKRVSAHKPSTSSSSSSSCGSRKQENCELAVRRSPSTSTSSNSSSSLCLRRSPRRLCKSSWRIPPVEAIVHPLTRPARKFARNMQKSLIEPKQPIAGPSWKESDPSLPSESDSIETEPPLMPTIKESAERTAAKLSARKRGSLARPARKFVKKINESPTKPKHSIAGPFWKEGDSQAEQLSSESDTTDVLFSPVELMEISCEELYTLNQEKHKPDDHCLTPVTKRAKTSPSIQPGETKSVTSDEIDNSQPKKVVMTEGDGPCLRSRYSYLRAYKARKVLPDAERKSQPKRKLTEGNENAGKVSVPSPLDVQRKKCLRNKFAEWNLFECSLIEVSNQAACDCKEEPVGLDKKLLDELRERRQRGNFPSRFPREDESDVPDMPGSSK